MTDTAKNISKCIECGNRAEYINDEPFFIIICKNCCMKTVKPPWKSCFFEPEKTFTQSPNDEIDYPLADLIQKQVETLKVLVNDSLDRFNTIDRDNAGFIRKFRKESEDMQRQIDQLQSQLTKLLIEKDKQ